MFYIIILIIIAYFIYKLFFKNTGKNNQYQDKSQYLSQEEATPYGHVKPIENQIEKEKFKEQEDDNDPFKGWSYSEIFDFVNETKNNAKKGNMESILTMINLYTNGLKGIIDPNKVEATKYMKIAADRGNMQMALNYAIRQDPESAECRKYMQMAADSGNADAQLNMYYILLGSSNEEDTKEASVYLNEACNAGNIEALNELRRILEKGGHSEKEIEEFLLKYKKSEQSLTNERKNDNQIKDNKLNDTELTPQQIQDLVTKLKEEADNGKVQSMVWLGDIYSQGQGGIIRDERLALKYWKMAADHGNTDMAFKAGLLIGRLDEDYASAFQYIKISAEAGNADAMYMLYNFLLNGWGCQKDENMAYEYLRAAAKAGQKDALDEINKW